MVNIEDAVIARFKEHGQTFEILVDGDRALLFKENKAELDDVLVTDDIFKDVKKGLHTSASDLQKVFKTTNKKEVAALIIKRGEIQLTAEHQRKVREETKKRIINIIHKNAVDPKTNKPHPPQRIENALSEAKVNIRLGSPESQIQEIIKKIQPLLPLKYEVREIELLIPAQYGAASFSVLKQFAKVLRSEWLGNGSLKAVVEIPAGMQSDFFDKLNSITHGSVESRIIKTL